MSLNYDLTAIPEDVRTVVATEADPINGVAVGDKVMNPVTRTLIWTTMGVGIGVINDDTLEEWVARVGLYQKLHGALMSRHDEEADTWVDRPLTREDIEAHKGLKTNVFPMETRASWVKRTITQSREIFPHPEPKKK